MHPTIAIKKTDCGVISRGSSTDDFISKLKLLLRKLPKMSLNQPQLKTVILIDE